ncbi:MAG: T9SS type A sorting domain-containing protein [Bacteroidota bacterium]
MRKIYYLMLLLAGMFILSTVSAQDILVVDPGDGTLNDAIDANGGNKIYQLQAGQWYGLTKVIENDGFHLQIIGEDYDDATMPATLQNGMTPDQLPFNPMITAKGDVTLQNIYLMGSDINGTVPSQLYVQSTEGATTVIDNCVIDPISQWHPFKFEGGMNDLYFTNNIALRHGHELSANDGAFFDFDAPVGFDTCLIQNNTFVSFGMAFMFEGWKHHLHNFTLVDHNTFVHNKSQLDWVLYEKEYYFTNNLMFDFMTSPYAYHWQPMPGGEASHPKPQLIYSDTLFAANHGVDETLPSERIQFVQYNSHYRNPGHYANVVELNDFAADSIPKVNLQPLIWDGTTDANLGYDPALGFAESREGNLFNHANNTNTDFPNWKYGNTMVDVDPLFNDGISGQSIYTSSDNLVEWQKPASYLHPLAQPSTNYPPPSEWAKWHWEPDGDVAINDTWPVFDGTYTEASTLTGSIANLPLGDLNWHPDQMAIWEENKDAIFEHMKAGNTEKFGGSGVEPVQAARSLSRVYPNPMTNSAIIEFTLDTPASVEIAIFNSIGQEVRSVMSEERSSGTHRVTIDRGDLNHGLYFYSIKVGNRTESQKLMILE